jgi:hypothetical protein
VTILGLRTLARAYQQVRDFGPTIWRAQNDVNRKLDADAALWFDRMAQANHRASLEIHRILTEPTPT